MKRNYLITGASRGIGFELARQLADIGHHVLATARNQQALEKLKLHAPGLIDILAADLTDPATPEMIRQRLSDADTSLDGVVHNAGLLINKPFEKLTDKDWQSVLEVNLLGPVRLTRTLLSTFTEEAHLVMISSMGGFQGSKKFPGLSAYSTAKGAVSILTEALAAELGEKGVAVNCLCLGAVQTEMFEEAFPGMKAPVNPEEMAGHICWFLLNGHRFYNGKVIPVAQSDP